MLPIAIVSSRGVDDKFASIDQVFNGFGYIGSTVFALPGVKVQIPNGRNEDGTYSFIEKIWLDTCEGDEGYPDKEYTVKSAWIDLNDYDTHDRECAICGYYDSLEKAYEIYGDSTEQIIAECIFEEMCNGECSTYGMMTETEADKFIQNYIMEQKMY